MQYKNKKQIEEEFEKKIPCTQVDCDGKGTYPDGNGEPNPCQYCYEYRLPMLDFITQIEENNLNAIKEMIEKDLKLNGSRTLLSVEIVKETLQKLDNLN